MIDDPVAQRSLGFLVQVEDPGRAMSLYRAAAEGGDAIAAFNVGMTLGKSPAAVPWLRQAAAAGARGLRRTRGVARHRRGPAWPCG
ncbi:hypothetical protein GCM10010435_94790 [Winogradskya consettensis]|uniref:Sel1 repeat family protein n=1 Tax=Winogradskya consettensis TaxID=113560 RepID=A0A919SXH7_9ACTN|nr:hypothetical protein [Actinoplanes consettensis]GIM79814.1 hypothetical protein Aco04nite_67430 [Actinoplanes consettensis]